MVRIRRLWMRFTADQKPCLRGRTMRWRERGKYCMRMRSLQRCRYDVLYHIHRPACNYLPANFHLVYSAYEFRLNIVRCVLQRNHLMTLVYCSRPHRIYTVYYVDATFLISVIKRVFVCVEMLIICLPKR